MAPPRWLLFKSPTQVWTVRRQTGFFKKTVEGFPGGAVVENLPANAGDTDSSPGLGGSHMQRSN